MGQQILSTPWVYYRDVEWFLGLIVAVVWRAFPLYPFRVVNKENSNKRRDYDKDNDVPQK